MPDLLLRRGFDRETLAMGDEVTVTAFRQLPGEVPATKFLDPELSESQVLLNEVYDRAVAGRLVHGLGIILPDGRLLISGGGIWRQDFSLTQ